MKEVNCKREKVINTLKESLTDLKNKFSFDDNTMNILSRAASQVPSALFDRLKKKIVNPNLKESYPSTLRSFAFTLHLFSPAAYR